MEEKHIIGNTIDDSRKKQKLAHYYGIKIDKMPKGDFSLGVCISYDGWLEEFYIYINAVKWSVSIGRLARF